MKIATKPYEFLIRWHEKGGLSGAHVIYRQNLVDDTGKVMLGDNGVPLMDVIGQAQPISMSDPEVAVIIGQAIVDMDAEAVAAGVENDALKILVKQLQDQIIALTPKPTPKPTPEQA